jgi:hypothetical protein
VSIWPCIARLPVPLLLKCKCFVSAHFDVHTRFATDSTLVLCLSTTTAPAAGHSAAREQYCDPVEYFSGQHAACFQQVRHHYYGDAHSLRFGPDESVDV